jgi:D-alanyl-D-alanine carboxypeptidase
VRTDWLARSRSASGVDPAAGRRLQGTLDRVRRDQEIPGAAATLIIGECIWVGASELADVRTREPVRDETLFQVGSITKTFVAATRPRARRGRRARPR